APVSVPVLPAPSPRPATDNRELRLTEQAAGGAAGLRRGAERVGGAGAAGRRGAAQVDARRLAATLWADATARESEGQGALERRNYALAQQRFREAQDDYQKALLEARAVAEQQRATQREEATKLKQELDRVRAGVAG